MEEQYKKTFDQMVDSLKMYQRYELKDKNRKDILDKVYVDANSARTVRLF